MFLLARDNRQVGIVGLILADVIHELQDLKVIQIRQTINQQYSQLNSYIQYRIPLSTSKLKILSGGLPVWSDGWRHPSAWR